jgi:hypothetical protein
MKFRSMLAASAVIVATGFGTVAIAQDLPFPVQARQGQFKMLGLNMGVLVGMARGEREYDADLAQAAANNVVALSTIDQSFHWPEGTDNMSLVGTLAPCPRSGITCPMSSGKWDRLRRRCRRARRCGRRRAGSHGRPDRARPLPPATPATTLYQASQ